MVITSLLIKFTIPAYSQTLYPDMYAHHEEKSSPMPQKTIYLTFDDGPSKNTSKLLEILNKNDVKATFFVIGKEEQQYKRLVKQMYDEGHTVAPHSYSHIYHQIYSSKENYLEDFNKIYNYIYEITGEHANIFRFPGGSSNALIPSRDIMKNIIKEMKDREFIYYDWNIVSGDDTATVYPKEVLFNNVKVGAKDKDNLVILFHDAPLCRTTGDAVEMVINYYKEKGYEFKPLNDTVEPIQFKK